MRQPKKAVHFIDDSVSSSDGEEKRPLPVKTNLSADKVKKIQHSNGKVQMEDKNHPTSLRVITT